MIKSDFNSYAYRWTDEFIESNQLTVSAEDRKAMVYFVHLMIHAGKEGWNSEFYRNLSFSTPPYTENKYVVCKYPAFKKYLEDNIMEFAYDAGRPLNISGANRLLSAVRSLCEES